MCFSTFVFVFDLILSGLNFYPASNTKLRGYTRTLIFFILLDILEMIFIISFLNNKIYIKKFVIPAVLINYTLCQWGMNE